MSNIILYPVTEIYLYEERFKLCVSKKNDIYMLRLCYNDDYDFNIFFKCDYDISTELGISNEMLVTSVERIANDIQMYKYIPLVLKRDKWTLFGAYIDLSNYDIISVLTGNSCGEVLKVTSNIKGIYYESESENSKRNSII